MKKINILFIALTLVLFAACESTPEDELPQGEMSMMVTGINQSLSYEFRAGNGRVASSADDVKNLTVLILNEANEIVHETHYYRYHEEQIVPDTIFIPSLSAGNYQLLAVTADFYYYYYDDFGFPEDLEDSLGVVAGNELVIPGYTISEGPIYVGKEDFTLEEEGQVVQIDMENISAKVTFKMNNGADFNTAWIEMGLVTENPWAYSFDETDFVQDDYSYVAGYLGDNRTSYTLYVMPQTLVAMNMNMYSYYTGESFNQVVDFEEPISLVSGDAITFTLDINALMEGAGEGVFNFGEINWNDRGELTLP
ncbi:MAG: FimB/Mfa2 family fimbrial subunit [Cyclobacteriaceae bacterium]